MEFVIFSDQRVKISNTKSAGVNDSARLLKLMVAMLLFIKLNNREGVVLGGGIIDHAALMLSLNLVGIGIYVSLKVGESWMRRNKKVVILFS